MIQLEKASTGLKWSILFLGMFALVHSLVLLKEALVPFCLSIFFSIIIQPLVGFLVNKGLNRILAILLPITGILIITLFLLIWLSSQFTLILNAIPIFIHKWDELMVNLTKWLFTHFGFSDMQIGSWISQLSVSLMIFSKSHITPLLMSFGSLLVWLVFIPVYTFMMLYYRPLLISVLFSQKQINQLSIIQDIYKSTNGIIRSYLQGLLLESSIVSVLNVLGLLILGLDYAFLLGILGGILNVIPYLGGMVAMFLPILVSLATKPIIYVFYIICLYTLIQLLDNNIIMPRIVSFKIQVNGLVSVFVVVLGGMMWGITGMFLSIPFSAILKVSLDHSKGYESWGRLLGNEMP